jgi:adenosylmethionine-8-amino-7-oxononanoate aminotransferase
MDNQKIFESMFLRRPSPLLVTRTEGVYFYTADGRKILDASGGPMAVNIGYGRREVAEAVSRSMARVSYVLPVYSSQARVELSERIRKFLPESLNRLYFCSGGSEANEAAIKLARQYHVLTGHESKYKIITRDLSYHGMTIATLSMGDIKMRKRDFVPMLWDSRRIQACYCYRCPFQRTYPGCDLECARALEKKILEEGPDTVSAFMAEPIVAAAAGATVPPPGYFPLIREICDRYGVLLIFDEVVTGFGRTGEKMGMNHFQVVPDLVTFAKGVSSAYAPLGGMAVKDRILEPFEKSRSDFQHLYTFSFHPLSCAVGNEVLRIIEEEHLLERAAVMGDYLSKRLARLESLPLVGDIRGKGLLRGIEFVRDKKTKEPFPREKSVKNRILRACFRKGVSFYPGYYEDELGRGDHIMISPPFIITEEQIDQCLDILQEAIEECREELSAS